MEDHMQQEQPPSYTQTHDPQSLNFPSVPTADPPPIHHERVLPPLPPQLPEQRFRAEEHQFVWPSSNPLTAYYQPGPSALSPKTQSSIGMDSPMSMDLDGTDSRGRRGGSVLSIDDPDVRLAAEALGDLRADFVGSPQQNNRALPQSSPRSHPAGGPQPEPLLSLLTTSHPIIGTAIGGSLSAYSASKNYSPRFKSSAEYVERRFTPVVNTVGSVGRMTGVEGGVRWFLGGRKPSHHQPDGEQDSQVPNKRRKFGTEDVDMESDGQHESYPGHGQDLQHRQRRPSQGSTVESLPAYDDYRSPSYEANALIPTKSQDEPRSPGSSWQSRLVLSTSGLSVAMSEESLRSLKYCLGWLRWANEHIGKVILALKSALEQYDSGNRANTSGAIEGSEQTGQLIVRSDAERSALNAKIAELKRDVLKTLKEVVDIVSKYAGGALPENARVLVRRHLTSLPQRFRLASSRPTEGGRSGENADMEVTEGANRVLVLAKEGLDMMAQVSGVLDGTIVSAEEWCERLRRSRREDGERETPLSPMEKPPSELPPMNNGLNGFGGDPDVKMG
ncbi:clock-controlled protein-like protein 8 [Cadophora sp. MPI-SDFR-AT-0126]|nr:clock-controlled protein-like protein 8 [Leotiomycetes sp. MPI-SDFR-AT-0126]